MFTISDRDRLRNYLLNLAATDDRVVAGAVVGSLAFTEGDRWSDLDLTFAVVDEVPILQVLDDWTADLIRSFGAVQLFDLPREASLYRVFFIPGCLQFDLSFTAASKFGAIGPEFRLLFRRAVEKSFIPGPTRNELFGYAVHHAMRARFCIERGRYWQAEYWISGVRDYALSLACQRRGFSPHYARGYDDLPLDVSNRLKGALVTALELDELLRALGEAIEGLLGESDGVESAAAVAPELRKLTFPRGS